MQILPGVNRGVCDLVTKQSQKMKLIGCTPHVMFCQLPVGAYKKVIYSNHLYVYSNELALLQSLNDLDFVKYPILTEAQVILPRDTIILKKPKYNFRTYFKMRGVTKQQIETLNDFFNLNKELIKPSPSLRYSLARSTHWLMDYQFADHSDPKLITVINLICPGITRKTLNIMAAK